MFFWESGGWGKLSSAAVLSSAEFTSAGASLAPELSAALQHPRVAEGTGHCTVVA